MKHMTLKVLAALVIASGGARVLAQESDTTATVCCEAEWVTLKCCGYTRCEAGKWACCADDGCDLMPTGSTD